MSKHALACIICPITLLIFPQEAKIIALLHEEVERATSSSRDDPQTGPTVRDSTVFYRCFPTSTKATKKVQFYFSFGHLLCHFYALTLLFSCKQSLKDFSKSSVTRSLAKRPQPRMVPDASQMTGNDGEVSPVVRPGTYVGAKEIWSARASVKVEGEGVSPQCRPLILPFYANRDRLWQPTGKAVVPPHS